MEGAAQTDSLPVRSRRSDLIIRHGNIVALMLLALHFFIVPSILIIYFTSDSGLRGPGTPRMAWWAHRRLTPKYGRWAMKRLARPTANENIEDISGTEWPLFGSVFYLWATESLQEAWEQGDRRTAAAPSVYAREAIEAAAALVTDPAHAAWVEKHWGKEYLHKEDAFYRMLLISAMTSHAKLLKSDKYLPALSDQVESLSREIDESPHGLLNDYPDQCYPTDVLAAIAAIQRADAVLGTDHSAFIERARRGFDGKCLDPDTGLPPYDALTDNGEPLGCARGCGCSYMTLNAPYLWPETAARWYELYEKHFWQYRWTAYGFREFPKAVAGKNWYMDVDSGPVVAGHGTAASAFAVGGARINGRFDHAWPLSAEMIATCWPLAGGTLAGPRILSNATDAPYLGEAAIIYFLTRQPAPGVQIQSGGHVPPYVYILLSIYIAFGVLLVFLAVRQLRRLRKQPSAQSPLANVQLALWAVLLTTGLTLTLAGHWIPGMALLLGGLLLPRDFHLQISRRG